MLWCLDSGNTVNRIVGTVWMGTRMGDSELKGRLQYRMLFVNMLFCTSQLSAIEKKASQCVINLWAKSHTMVPTRT